MLRFPNTCTCKTVVLRFLSPFSLDPTPLRSKFSSDTKLVYSAIQGLEKQCSRSLFTFCFSSPSLFGKHQLVSVTGKSRIVGFVLFTTGNSCCGAMCIWKLENMVSFKCWLDSSACFSNLHCFTNEFFRRCKLVVQLRDKWTRKKTEQPLLTSLSNEISISGKVQTTEIELIDDTDDTEMTSM